MTGPNLLAQLETVPWRPRPEVWLLIAGAVAIGWYAAKIVQPKAVAAGLPALTRRQKAWYVFAVAGMWASSDWPVHDIAEEHLYFVHMIQHLMLSMIVPAAFVLATPRWLLELVIPRDSAVWRAFRWSTTPLRAGLIFNALTIVLHWSVLVELSAESAAIHYALHLMIFLSGLFMWMPVCGPIAEWQLSPPGKMIFLFLMSVIPTVPSGWLIFAEDVVYQPYDTAERLWGIDVLSDQQAAGVVMKLVGGFFLWGVIVVVFARWSLEEQRKQEQARRDRRRAGVSDLTTAEIDEAFSRSAPVAEG